MNFFKNLRHTNSTLNIQNCVEYLTLLLKSITICLSVLSSVAESDSCSSNEDCAADKACVREKCADPCSGACEEDYVCEARNHLATCYQRDDHSEFLSLCLTDHEHTIRHFREGR